MWILLMIFELLSIAILAIMYISNGLPVVFSDFERRNKYSDITFTLTMMALLGGWFLCPYFIWLAYRYYKLTH